MANSLKESEIMLGQRFKDCFKANIGRVGIVSKQLEEHTQDITGCRTVTRETITTFEANQREIINEPYAKSKAIEEIPKTPGHSFYVSFADVFAVISLDSTVTFEFILTRIYKCRTRQTTNSNGNSINLKYNTEATVEYLRRLIVT